MNNRARRRLAEFEQIEGAVNVAFWMFVVVLIYLTIF